VRKKRLVPLNTIFLLPCFLVRDPLFKKLIECRPEFLEIILGHAEAAGRTDLVDVHKDDCTSAWYGFDPISYVSVDIESILSH
jgi:hypothetical protein